MGSSRLLLAMLVLLAGTVGAGAADKARPDAPVTQQEFVVRLADATGLKEGLPEKPAFADYLALMDGNRSFRFEAEDIYDKGADRVTVRDFNVYGPFTGRGWLSGITVPTPVHFRVLLPQGGKYTFSAAARGDGQLWSIAGKGFRVNAGPTLREVPAGTINLTPGYLDFNVMLPADGALDYVRFDAPQLPPAAPLAGWKPAEPLKRSTLAEIVVPLLGLEGRLPVDTRVPVKVLSAAVYGKLPAGAEKTDSTIFGRPLAPSWVKTGGAPAVIELPLTIEATAPYRLRVRFTAASLDASIAGRNMTAAGKPYFDWYDLGTVRLTAGSHTLQLKAAPFAGVDVVELTRLSGDPADYLSLAGITGKPSATVTGAELDAILPGIAARLNENR